MTHDDTTRRIADLLLLVPEEDHGRVLSNALRLVGRENDRQRRTKTREIPVLRPIADEEPEILPDDEPCPDVVASEEARGVVRS